MSSLPEGDKTDLDESDFRSRLSVALTCAIIALGLGTLYGLARVGFENPVRPIASAITLSWWLSLVPLALREFLRKRQGNNSWYSSESFLSLAVIAFTGLFGWLAPRTGLNVFPGLALAAALLVVVFATRLFRVSSPGKMVWAFVGILMITVWAAGLEWSNGFLNPLYIENLILHGGTDHIDTLYHSSVANMVRLHGVPSIGWDGIPFLAYHFGSGWLFAQMANLTGMSTINFYQLGVPVVIVPLFLRGIFVVAHDLRYASKTVTGNGPHSIAMWVLFCSAAIGILPPAALHAAGVWLTGPLLSESYTVAVPLSLLLIACVVYGWDSGQRSFAPFLVLIVPLGVAAVGIVKVSQMLLLLGLGLWFFVRARAYRRSSAIAALILSFLLGYLTFRYVVWSDRNGGFVPLNFMRVYLPPEGWPYFIFIHFFWSWVFIALRIATSDYVRMRDVWHALRQHKLPDVEAVLLLSLLGILPGNLFAISSDSYYFSDFQRWFSLALICANATLLVRFAAKPFKGWTSLGALSPRQFGMVFVAIPMVLSLVVLPIVWSSRFVRVNFDTRRELQAIVRTNPPVGLLADFKAAVRTGLSGSPSGAINTFRATQIQPLADRPGFDAALKTSPRFSVVQALMTVGNLGWDERRQSVLFIPPSIVEYWSILPFPNYCAYSAMVGPALAGTPMLDGVPPGCSLPRYPGMEAYQDRARWSLGEGASDEQLCSRAREKGFYRVLRMHRTVAGIAIREIACPGATVSG